VGRWIRHHRAFTYTAAAALLAISMVASVCAVVIDGARRSETVAHLEAEKNLALARDAKRREEIARQEAEANFFKAQHAVDEYFTSVSENTLLKEQETLDIRTLRQDLLRTALRYYEEFARERKSDPRLRRQLAKAYYRVGLINGEIGSHDEAIKALTAALEIWSPLFDFNGGDHEAGDNLSECYLAIGRIQSLDHNFQPAMNSLGRSRKILEQLREENPTEARYQARLADCYAEIGIALAKLDRLDESLDIHAKARVLQEGLIKEYKDELAYQKSLAENINAMGAAQAMRRDDDAAKKAFLEVRDICVSIKDKLPAGPKPLWLLNLLALSQYNLGVGYKKSGAITEALPFFEQSLASQSALVDSHPSVTRFQEKLGGSYCEIAELQHAAHDDAKAIEWIRKAIDVFDSLVRAHPEQANHHNWLAYCWRVASTTRRGKTPMPSNRLRTRSTSSNSPSARQKMAKITKAIFAGI
jgi:tetratricopeptide (TPR) repeat protein